MIANPARSIQYVAGSGPTDVLTVVVLSVVVFLIRDGGVHRRWQGRERSGNEDVIDDKVIRRIVLRAEFDGRGVQQKIGVCGIESPSWLPPVRNAGCSDSGRRNDCDRYRRERRTGVRVIFTVIHLKGESRAVVTLCQRVIEREDKVEGGQLGGIG